jgi:hypothetical protein
LIAKHSTNRFGLNLKETAPVAPSVPLKMKSAVFLTHLAIGKQSDWHQKIILEISIVSPLCQA